MDLYEQATRKSRKNYLPKFNIKRKWQDISVTQQIVTIVKMNILNQTKDARSVIVRHTRKDLFGMSDADE